MNNVKRIQINEVPVRFSKTDAKDNLIVSFDKKIYYWSPVTGFDTKHHYSHFADFSGQLLYACQVMWGWL